MVRAEYVYFGAPVGHCFSPVKWPKGSLPSPSSQRALCGYPLPLSDGNAAAFHWYPDLDGFTELRVPRKFSLCCIGGGCWFLGVRDFRHPRQASPLGAEVCLGLRLTAEGRSQEQSIAEGETREGSEAKKRICVPQISGPLDKFHFLPQEIFSDVGGWVGGWVSLGW